MKCDVSVRFLRVDEEVQVKHCSARYRDVPIA
jgi:hypothetical protein